VYFIFVVPFSASKPQLKRFRYEHKGVLHILLNLYSCQKKYHKFHIRVRLHVFLGKQLTEADITLVRDYRIRELLLRMF
jgi:hypothetical protein